MENSAETITRNHQEYPDPKETAQQRKNRKQREKRAAAKANLVKSLKPCKHSSILVALNPGPNAKILDSFTSSKGDVIANVCSFCSELTSVPNVFGEQKKVHRSPKLAGVLIPLTEDGLSWLETSPFPHVSAVSEQGITMFTQQSLILPPGGQYLKCFPKNSVAVGKCPKYNKIGIPTKDAILLAKTFMK